MNDRARLELSRRFPHCFTLQYPPAREYFQQHFRSDADLNVLSSIKKILLYVHVPFCETRCSYCNFAVSTLHDRKFQSRYVDGLLRELDALSGIFPSDVRIHGIDVGGGTPTLLETRVLSRLLKALQPWKRRRSSSVSHSMLSIETTPRAACEMEKMTMLAAGGVDRISVGIQSADEILLRQINRRGQLLNENAVVCLKQSGFKRVNVDLIFGMPGQNLTQWEKDLRFAADTGADSITTYDCLYRGGGRRLADDCSKIPPQEIFGGLYDSAYAFLMQNGYHAPYGSLNFSRHPDETGTSAYFEGRLLDGMPYIGIGNYASSYVDGSWWFAPHDVSEWLSAVESGAHLPRGDSYGVPEEEWMAKAVLLSLSFGFVDGRRFYGVFGKEIEKCFAPSLETAKEEGWLAARGGKYFLQPGCFRFMPQIRSLFYSPRAIRWLRETLGNMNAGKKTVSIAANIAGGEGSFWTEKRPAVCPDCTIKISPFVAF